MVKLKLVWSGICAAVTFEGVIKVEEWLSNESALPAVPFKRVNQVHGSGWWYVRMEYALCGYQSAKFHRLPLLHSYRIFFGSYIYIVRGGYPPYETSKGFPVFSEEQTGN